MYTSGVHTRIRNATSRSVNKLPTPTSQRGKHEPRPTLHALGVTASQIPAVDL